MAARAEAPFLTHAKVSPEQAQSLLRTALGRGGDFAELYFEYNRYVSLSLEDGRIKTVSGATDLGVGVRVVDGDAVGYAFAEQLEPRDMDTAAQTAAHIARAGKQVRPTKVGARRAPQRYRVNDPMVDASGNMLAQVLREADTAARAHDACIRRVEGGLVAVHKEILICTSDGVMVHDTQPMIRLSVSAVAERGKRREVGSSGGGGRYGWSYLQRVSAADHGREAARVAVLNLDSRPAPAGTFPVVLAPGDSGILLHEAVGHGLEADFNRKKTSNYSEKIGSCVASKLVTVVDDPALAGSRGSVNVDDEGEVPKAHRLIVGGMLRAYLYDKMSAKHFFGKDAEGRAGSGRRESFRSVPMPRMTNTYMTAGKDDPHDIVKSVKKGVYAKKFSGGQVNISNGDFVFSLVEGYLIEDGRITAPLKGVNLIGNGPQALQTVSMVGHDFELSDGMWTCGKDGQSVPVGVGMPTVRLDALTVGGTQV